MRLDRFKQIPEELLQAGADLNIREYRNEYSPYMSTDKPMDRMSPGYVLVDELYGQAYDHIPVPGAGIYGITQAMPAKDLDDRAGMGFLRLPFARVPRFRVRDRKELETLIGQLPRRAKSSPLLYRGQNREHLLGRNVETLQALYADANAMEPSLLPSGARAGLDLNTIMPEWSAILKWALGVWFDDGKQGIGARELDAFQSHYLFRRFAAAIAQHYGLPSSGLDVTTKLDVGLFFALTSFAPTDEGDGALQCLPVDKERSAPVLYLMEPYPERVQSDFSSETPTWLPLARPQRQAAHFVHRGWGFSQNEAAHWLVAAFYLDPVGDFGPLPSCADLFPSAEVDLFVQIGTMLTKTMIHNLLPELGRFLSFFQVVRPASS